MYMCIYCTVREIEATREIEMLQDKLSEKHMQLIVKGILHWKEIT